MGIRSGAPKIRGVMIARLLARFPYLIIAEPDCIFFLRHGMRCKYAPGTDVKILYAENDDGVKDVISIQPASAAAGRAPSGDPGTAKNESLNERANVSETYSELLDFALAHGGCAGARTVKVGPYAFDGYHVLVRCGCGPEFARWAVQEDMDADCLRAALLAF